MPTLLLIDGPKHNQSFDVPAIGQDVRFLFDEPTGGRYVLDSLQSQLDESTLAVYKWKPDEALSTSP